MVPCWLAIPLDLRFHHTTHLTAPTIRDIDELGPTLKKEGSLMPDVNPMLHLDENFMWRWYEIDDQGHTSFLSSKAFFFREDCRQDYDVAMRRSKSNLN
jgi:hypothetical protein